MEQADSSEEFIIGETVLEFTEHKIIEWQNLGDHSVYRAQIDEDLTIDVARESDFIYTMTVYDADLIVRWEDAVEAGGGRYENFHVYQKIWLLARNSDNKDMVMAKLLKLRPKKSSRKKQ